MSVRSGIDTGSATRVRDRYRKLDSPTVGQCMFEGVEGRVNTTRGWPLCIVFDVNV